MRVLKPTVPVVKQPLNKLAVTAYYSGTKGFYCSMYPTNETLVNINNHFSSVPQLKDSLVVPPLMHVTIMHSNSAIPMPELPWINRDVVLRGRAIGYDYFCKPHATEGAVVMLLESTDLEGYHEELKKMAEYTWDEYRPHLTLAYGVAPTDAAIIISALNAMPLLDNLSFTAPVFEDKS